MNYHSIGPFVAYLFMLSALLHIAKTSWVVYKAESGGTSHLALSCVCAGMLLFMTVVPGAMFLASPHHSIPYQEINAGDI
jgi:hypothetical protein